MEWKYEKFKDNEAIYQVCPKCEFVNMVGSAINFDGFVSTGYNYCPMCGEYLHTEKEEIDIVWNERNLHSFELDE